ncbi:cation:proton antiporter domain-containing protein [Rhodovibrionaceae bacterium A322]
MPDTLLPLLAISTILLTVGLLVPLSERLKLPLPLLLALLGLGIGFSSDSLFPFLVENFGVSGDLGADVLRGIFILGLGSDAFLAIFLPPLLFAAGLGVDVRLLQDQIWAVLVMAVVAVVVCALLVGGVLFGVSFSLTQGQGPPLVVWMLLGAIVATTDPGVVIGIFKNLGAPKGLTTLVAGESLFNDAAAIALFALLLDQLSGTGGYEVGSLIGSFLRDFLGGALLGFVLARLLAFVLSRLGGSNLAEITASVALCYLSFLIGEHYFHVSGVVAVVVAALVLGVEGSVRLLPENWRTLAHVWDQLDFWASSLVVVLAAMLTAEFLPSITRLDLLLLVALVGAALLARAAILYGLLPGLVRFKLTKPMSGKQSAVLLWGGLRGATTLVLAISIARDEDLSEEVKHFVSVLAVAYTFFTLFVQGGTLQALIRLTGLNKLSPRDQALRDQVLALSRSEIQEHLSETALDLGMSPDEISERSGPKKEHMSAALSLSPQDRREAALMILVQRERQLITTYFTGLSLSRRLLVQLLATSNRLADAVKATCETGYGEEATKQLAFGLSFRAGLFLQKQLGWGGQLSKALADRFDLLLLLDMMLRELKSYNSTVIRQYWGREVSEQLAGLLDSREQQIAASLSAFELQYPGYAKALKFRHLARTGLRLEEAAHRAHLEEGLISGEVFNSLSLNLQENRAKVEQRPDLDLGLQLAAMMRRVPLFANLNKVRLAKLALLLHAKVGLPGEKIVRTGDVGRHMYFIASGAVKVLVPESDRQAAQVIRLGAGDFFGEVALLRGRRRIADVVVEGYANLLVLPAKDFKRVLRQDPQLKAQIEEIARQREQEEREG